MHHFTFRVYSLQVFRGQTRQESNLTILSMPFFETRQVRHFIKHAKHAILWSTSSTLFYEARQARHFMKHSKRASFLKHAKDVSTPSTRAGKARKACEHASTPFIRLIKLNTRKEMERSEWKEMEFHCVKFTRKRDFIGSRSLHKICENAGFYWPVISRIRQNTGQWKPVFSYVLYSVYSRLLPTRTNICNLIGWEECNIVHDCT